MKRTIFTILTAGMVSAAALSGPALASDNKDQAEIALFQSAQTDVAAAIRAAETATGGTAISAEFDEKNGAGRWEVKTVTGTARTEVKIDATTGQVIETKDKGDLSGKRNPVTPDMLGGSLLDMVTRAETQGAGKVMSIEAEHENGQFVGLDVEIVKADGTVQDFLLNPADGTMTPVVDNDD
ncbi:MAG: PepSY domain-containing protein [Paracoccus sp. (in: a-proteobacteria)]|uniref:PepSY domain-containing protein n=1 Tax=Paracoccus sp. TaxID=267 RepID=UPI0026DED250|nr:PepSY domain-containing protein [Paracoccus sp. (in: a-proteobacteria)]MDO5622702.1 PepSY domain-containing protein [Paracoccus sp. (in: a-proteobacteria)]